MATLELKDIVTLENESLFEAVDELGELDSVESLYILARFYEEMKDSEQLRHLVLVESEKKYIQESWVFQLVYLKALNIENKMVPVDLVTFLENQALGYLPVIWKGEIYNEIAKYYMQNNKFHTAVKYWSFALESYSSLPYGKIHIKIKQSMLRCETVLNPSQSILSKWQQLLLDAETQNCRHIKIQVQYSIAKEFASLNQYDEALDMVSVTADEAKSLDPSLFLKLLRLKATILGGQGNELGSRRIMNQLRELTIQ